MIGERLLKDLCLSRTKYLRGPISTASFGTLWTRFSKLLLEKQRLRVKLPAGLSATVTAAAAVPSSGATRRFRTGFIDVQRSAVNIRPVQSTNCLIGLACIAHFDKCKTSRLSRVTTCHDVHAINGAVGFKQPTDLLFSSPETEISYKDILHLFFLLT
jgi:hypothetical protein